MDELSQNKLSKFRTQIDDIDQQILELLAKRTEFVEQVGDLKKRSGEQGAYIRPGREAKMIKKIIGKGAGNFPKQGLYSIWRTIISASLVIESEMKVAMPRSKNFNMHKLIIEYFGTSTPYLLCDTVEAAIGQIKGATIGVLNVQDNWWLNDLGNIKVFAKLHDELFALAEVSPEKTGDDKTLIASKTELPDEPHLAVYEGQYLYEVDGFFESESEIDIQGDFRILGSYS